MGLYSLVDLFTLTGPGRRIARPDDCICGGLWKPIEPHRQRPDTEWDKKMRLPGVEPGSIAWKAIILTVGLQTPSCLQKLLLFYKSIKAF